MKKATSESVVIARHINAFLNKYVPFQKSSSSHTLKSYQYALALYIGFLETEKGICAESLRGGCFSRIIIEEWLQWLMEQRGCSPETCNNRLASLRTFLKYIGSTEIRLLYLSEDATRIPRKKEVRKIVKGMSKKAVQVLLSIPDLSRKTGRRDLSLMIVIYSTAARIDEILSLKTEQLHLDVEKPNITIIGKGSKIRTLYLLPKAVAHLKKYLGEFHGDTPDPEAYVFYSRNTGSQGGLGVLVIKIMKQTLLKTPAVGVDFRISGKKADALIPCGTIEPFDLSPGLRIAFGTMNKQNVEFSQHVHRVM
jgi:site-specific recombinase XerD